MRVGLYKPAGQALFLSGLKVGCRAGVGYNGARVDQPSRPDSEGLRTTKDCM